MATALQAVRGMNDVLPDEAPLWQRFEDAARRVCEGYGYRNLRVPIVEPTPLYVRGIGEHTDVVEKEMYTFEDRLNGESLTLRPEATAGIVRAAIQHSLTYERPLRVWTAGPMFRHERPQKGRYRQFQQLDAEALGFAGPDVDAEQIVMLARLWRELGIDGVRLSLNSIGDPDERRAHRAALIGHFERHHGRLDEDSKRRLHANPLRILDSKNPDLQELIQDAPKLIDGLGPASREHFDETPRAHAPEDGSAIFLLQRTDGIDGLRIVARLDGARPHGIVLRDGLRRRNRRPPRRPRSGARRDGEAVRQFE